MAMYYVDTSAVVKRYINEQGSAATRRFFVVPYLINTSVITLP